MQQGEAISLHLCMLNGMTPCAFPTPDKEVSEGLMESGIPVGDPTAGCMWLMATTVLPAFFLCIFTLVKDKKDSAWFLQTGGHSHDLRLYEDDRSKEHLSRIPHDMTL